MKIIGFATLLVSILFWNCTPEKKSEASEFYNEPHRPQYHFTPANNWMNDPNGMVYFDGEYHLFYQHYPDSNVWGPMHWGHAVSKDLVRWQHLPIALYPDSLGMIFSGSCVMDIGNTSGFGLPNQPAMIAIFTQHFMEGEKSGRHDFQTQGIAFSLDKGRTWKKYEGNPVIKNPGKHDFRDPKVIWHELSKQWIMILAVKDHVEFYSSPNLKDWNYLSDFGTTTGAHGGVWECPDLFELNVEGTQETKWVLLLSINPGAPNGGSGTQYFIGQFNGKEFESEIQDTLWVDYGKDNYAGVTWSNIPKKDGRRLFLGWMSNWQYATVVPTTAWRSANTLPRELTLVNTGKGLRIASNPLTELESLRNTPQEFPGWISATDTVSKEIKLSSGQTEIVFEIERENAQQGFELELKNGKGEKILIGPDDQLNQFYIDRSQAGIVDFSPGFPGRHVGPRTSSDLNIKLRLFLDTSSLEFFADEGTLTMTEIFFPSIPFDAFKIRASNGGIRIKSVTVYSLQSIWKE